MASTTKPKYQCYVVDDGSSSGDEDHSWSSFKDQYEAWTAEHLTGHWLGTPTNNMNIAENTSMSNTTLTAIL